MKLRKVDGRDVIDVRFRLRTPLKDDIGQPMELDTLTCFVQLHVPGVALEAGADGRSTLVVPTTAGGVRLLKAVVRADRTELGPEVSSMDVN